MLIYLIRHGETDYNLTHRFQGMWVESQLTENGRAQAKAASALLKNVSFDRLYVSAADRTRETAAILFPERTDAVYRDELREVDVGSLANMYLADIQATYRDWYAKSADDKDYADFGGESQAEMKARAKGAIERILADGGETVAVVSHGGTIRYLLWALTGIEPGAAALLPNCSFAAVEVKGERAMLKQYGWNPMDASYSEAY